MNIVQDALDRVEWLNDTIARVSRNGDTDMLSMYEEKLKNAEFELLKAISTLQLPEGEDITLTLYRTTYFGIVSPQMARRMLNGL